MDDDENIYGYKNNFRLCLFAENSLRDRHTKIN